MEETRILIFGGTTEGRIAADYLTRRQIQVHVCVATEYGEQMLTEHPNLTVSHRRMDQTEMEAWIQELGPRLVIDATHPYAREVTENLREACKKRRMPYLRLLRETKAGGEEVYVSSIQEAAAFLGKTSGNVLVTTGSKELKAYQALEAYRERLYVRVLPFQEGLQICESMGIPGSHIIAMQGPFSKELNVALLRQYEIRWMVTKESGRAGGYLEKQAAARETGVRLVVVEKPLEETGYTWPQLCRLLTEELSLTPCWQVTLAGIGPGAANAFTREAWKACQEADLLIGARRMLEAAARPGQETYAAYQPEEILSYIHAHPERERITVALSGDIGFYSGARRLEEVLGREKEIQIKRIPGVSSAVYFCARMGIPWEDVGLVSIHGRQTHILSVLRERPKVLVLAGKDKEIRTLGSLLTHFGFRNVKVTIGERLSYQDERILYGDPGILRDYEGEGPALLYLENPQGGKREVVHGLPDEGFLRGDVPMTKEEVRSVSLSKLRLKRDSVVYDIGAGTGSVAVEAALQAWQGQVYAVERLHQARELIRENARRFQADNLTVIQGEAPEALAELPAPDCVFIGGSGGKLRQILEAVFAKNPEARVVINAITLETVSEAVDCLNTIELREEEVVHMSAARSRKAGSYHMMQGQNPIYIISMTGGKEACPDYQES